MKFFTKKEILAILIILLGIGLASYYNFLLSLRRARDAQRKDDLGGIATALAKYNQDFGSYPTSSFDGKIVACKDPNEKLKKDSKGRFIVNFIPCEWGKDSLRDVTDPNFLPYLKVIPQDVDKDKGASYRYFSNGRRFQLYAFLEGKDEDEYSLAVEKRGISCGTRICNFGKSSGVTPLDKSIEEYENELEKK